MKKLPTKKTKRKAETTKPAKETKANRPSADHSEPSQLSIDLLAAINASEFSRYEIAKRAGISESVLSLFASGQRSMTLDTAGRVADVLGLRLAAVKR